MSIFSKEVNRVNDIKFVNYSTENGLLQSSVKAIKQDIRGYLWVGTHGGLHRFNGEKFEILKDKNGENGLHHSFIRELFEDTYGNMWIISKSGISYFNYAEGKIEKFYEVSGRSMEQLGDKLYLGSDSGMYTINPNSFEINKIESELLNELVIFSIAKFENKLVLGTHKGLFYYNPVDGKLEKGLLDDKINRIVNTGEKTYVLTDNQVLYLNKDKKLSLIYEEELGLFSDVNYYKSILYIACDKGLMTIDEKTGKKSFYNHIVSDRYSLPNDKITSLYRDKNEILWIGSYTGGLSKENKIKYIRNFDSSEKGNLINNNIHAMIFGDKNEILIGHDKGFSVYDKESSKTKNLLENMPVWSIEKDEKYYYLGTKNNGLFIFDKNFKLIKNLVFSEIIENIKRINVIFNEKDFLLIGTYGNGLIKLNKKDYSYEIFSVQTKNLASNFVWDIEKGNNNEYYLGTEDAGIIILNLVSKSYKLINTQNSGIKENTMWQLKKYGDNLYIGTWDSGLYKYNLKTKKTIHYNTKNGLLDDTIYAIETVDGKVWVSSDMGIAEILENGEINVYDISHGLQDNEFNIGASLVDFVKKEVYFGGIKGISVIPVKKQNKKSGYYIYLDRIMTNFEEVRDLSKIKLPYDNSYLVFNLAVLDFFNSGKSKVEYRLKGFDKEWHSTTEKTIQYTNLPSGDYKFEAYGINNEGIKSENSIEVNIVVGENPFWNIWTMYFYVIMIILITYGASRFYIRDKLLHEKINCEALEKEKILEIKDAKENFLSNMSHEIKNPLQSILSASEILKFQNFGNPEKYINVIWKSTESLLYLVNDILDISKFEKNKIKLRNDFFSLRALFEEMKETYEIEASNKNLVFTSEIEVDSYTDIIFSDEMKIKQILNNLLSNALKYTFEGEIYFLLKLFEEEDKSYLRIMVKDTGIGIKEHMLPKIFDMYERDNAENLKIKGAGLGLSITKNLVETLKGVINTESMFNFGSIFTVELPVEVQNIIIEEEKIELKKINGKVLLVEDNMIIAEMTKDILENIGLEVDYTFSGRNALMLADSSYDLVISDYYLEDLRGDKILSEIKEKVKGIKTVLMTAESPENIEKVEVDMILYKPIRIEKIYEGLMKIFKNEKLDSYKEYLLKLNMSNQEIKKLIEDNYREIEEGLNKARENSDEKLYKKTVHKLKGSISFWGNDNLEELTNNLSDTFDNDISFEENLKEIKREIDRITKNI